MTATTSSERRWPLGTWIAVLLVWLVANVLVGAAMLETPSLVSPNDWTLWTFVPGLLADGTLYDNPYFVWSPIAAYLLILVVTAGYPVWFSFHAVALALMREPRIGLLTLFSLPFWADTLMGNAMVFVAVAGFLAVRGSRGGALSFLALTFLMPRPVQLPLAAWLLWRDRALWIPVLAMGIVTLGVAIASGYLDDWIASSIPFGHGSMGYAGNVGPTALIGPAWYAIGLPLAVWLTWKGRVGFAGLVLSNYVAPQYLLALLWEAPRTTRSARPMASRHSARSADDQPVPST